jgi:hypothetical protein
MIVNVCENYLVTVSNKGVMKCWDLNRREARPLGIDKKFPETG